MCWFTCFKCQGIEKIGWCNGFDIVTGVPIPNPLPCIISRPDDLWQFYCSICIETESWDAVPKFVKKLV